MQVTSLDSMHETNPSTTCRYQEVLRHASKSVMVIYLATAAGEQHTLKRFFPHITHAQTTLAVMHHSLLTP